MNLGQLAAACRATLRGEATLPASGITHRSQDVRPGWVFAALPGTRRHGIEFAGEAAGCGATAVLSDREPPAPLAWLASEQPRRAAALASWALAGSPQRRLRLVGITGTNGKSTVADLLGGIAGRPGEAAGVFGTLAYRLPHRSEPAGRTTLEAPDLAPLLAELVEAGGTVAVIEVSSHALRLERVAGLEFDVAVWTNLTRDHLDFHADLDDYFAAKASLAGLLRAAVECSFPERRLRRCCCRSLRRNRRNKKPAVYSDFSRIFKVIRRACCPAVIAGEARTFPSNRLFIRYGTLTGQGIFAHSRSSTSEGFCLIIIKCTVFEYLQNKSAQTPCPVNIQGDF